MYKIKIVFPYLCWFIITTQNLPKYFCRAVRKSASSDNVRRPRLIRVRADDAFYDTQWFFKQASKGLIQPLRCLFKESLGIVECIDVQQRRILDCAFGECQQTPFLLVQRHSHGHHSCIIFAAPDLGGKQINNSQFKPLKLLFLFPAFIDTSMYPVSILHKSISGRHRPVRVADGPMTARCRFT